MSSHDSSNTLKNIIFITLPKDLDRNVGEFNLDPDIPLPVETHGDQNAWDLAELRWEMILSAILKLLAYQPEHEDIEYYRNLAIAVKPDLAEELSQAGISKAQSGDFDLAEEIFLALSGLVPESPAPRLNLALLQEQMADSADAGSRPDDAERSRERAFQLYKSLLSEEDPPAAVYLNAGYFAVKTNNYDAAVRHLQSFLEMEPEHDRAEEVRHIVRDIQNQNLADTTFKEAYDFIRLGREQDGIEKIQEFLGTRPDVWNAWFLLGWGLRRLERYGEAAEAFEKSLELGPRKSDTLNELAICRMELGQLQDSEKLLSEALRQEPENIKLISNLGILSLKNNNSEEARSYFRAALELEPNDALSLSYLQQLDQKK